MVDKNQQSLARLLSIMTELRSETGCPWDKEQNTKSLRKYVIEEAYEVVDAIDCEDEDLLIEELGDLLLQVVFLAEIGREQGRYTFSDIADGISEKMVRRHPHVFGDGHCDTADEVLLRWAEIKEEEKEKKEKKERRLDIPKPFPALYRSQKIQKKASEVGFDWQDDGGIKAKILEEIKEFEAALKGEGHPQEELGDLLFSVVNWSRFHHIDAEEALRESNEKFIKRFYSMEDAIHQEGKSLEDMTQKEMDVYWEKVKEQEDDATR